MDPMKTEAEIRAEHPGCTFPFCMCRAECAIAKGETPDDGNPFKRVVPPYGELETLKEF